MLLKPPSFDASKKYPVLMVLHGGPETQFGDTWSYRWNTQTFAAPGYAVLMINRRGSTGFGQQFTDDINDDWGGKAYEDLMKGLDAALAKYAFLDGTRVAAAGASYGGYMIGWMASQSKGRFKTLVCHAGVYDLTSMYGATEEVWFPEWSFKGTPWANRDNFQRQSPHRAGRRLRHVQDADARHPRRARLPRALHAGPRVLHGAPAAGRALAADRLSRRRPLDSETAEQRVLVRTGDGVAQEISVTEGFRVPGFKVPGFKVPGFKVPGFNVQGSKVPGFIVLA